MKSHGPTKGVPGPDDGHKRVLALKSAIALRNCALGPQAGGAGRSMFRTRMREQALRWRDLAVTAG